MSCGLSSRTLRKNIYPLGNADSRVRGVIDAGNTI